MPRWRGNAMEVGPLARTLIAYHKGDAATVESVDRMMSALNLPLSGIQSTLGRILCRAHEAQWAAGKLQYFFNKLMTNLKTAILPPPPRKMGTHNLADRVPWCRFYRSTARALGHWAAIRDGKIDLYQCVVPTTGTPARAIPKGRLALMKRR